MALTKVITGVTDLNQAQSTNGLKFPTGSVFAGTPEEGMIRNDQSQSSETSSSAMQFYNGTAWKNFVNKSPIPLGSDNFNTVLYTGNGGTQAITGAGFEPDFTWIKQRSGGASHSLQDSVRGAGQSKNIYSDNTAAEGTYGQYGYLSAFGTDGFTVVQGSGSHTNANSSTYVAWNWKAGGTAVSNTDGTITSQVSANTAAGFSIVSYTGNSSSSATVGHGLDSTPELTIFKQLSSGGTSGGYWNVYYTPSNIVGFLNETNALASNNGGTNGSVDISNMDSTKFGFLVGSSSVNNQNNNLSEYIVYAFHSVAGYSKIGSYTGTNGVGTNTIVTGFEPAFVMIKRTDSTGNWRMYDDARNPGAVPKEISANLAANSSAAEYNDTNPGGGYLFFSSTGFYFPSGYGNADINGTGDYIFMAFAAT